jgi:hypothetical protein
VVGSCEHSNGHSVLVQLSNYYLLREDSPTGKYRKIMNYGKDMEETTNAYFEVVFKELPGRTEQNHEAPYSGHWASE